MNELANFAEKWGSPNYPPTAVIREDLDAAENQLTIKFPQDYRFQILSVGLPSPTLALLSAISDQDIDLHDLSSLYQPSEIISSTLDWRKIGMPEYLVAIGSDSLGNQFCFDERDLKSGRAAQSPVFHWDHDFSYTEQMAPSFSVWIGSYLASWSDGISATDF